MIEEAYVVRDAVLTFQDLKERKGWPFTRQYTNRLIRKGQFPHPFRIAGGRRVFWRESDIDAYFAERARETPRAWHFPRGQNK